jgi:uracil-DNA glycosylase
LAPAAHGGNITVRIFTGDSSDWLSRALFKTGFANKPSVTKNDGLILKGVYLTWFMC